jgi:hypothetical protein
MTWPERLIDLRAEDQLRYRDRDVYRYARQIAAESRQDAQAYLGPPEAPAGRSADAWGPSRAVSGDGGVGVATAAMAGEGLMELTDFFEEPRCLAPYVDWMDLTWTCRLASGHLGDHYSEDNGSWCWYRGGF